MSPREHVDLVPAEELYGLFAPHRPERAAFRAGIERRVAARAAGRGDGEADENEPDVAEEPAHASFWRRAAAWLPLDPQGAALGGASVAKALGGKVLPAALALPALVLATAFGGFAAAARSLRRSKADAAPVDHDARRLLWKRGSQTNRTVGPKAALPLLIQFGAPAAFLVTWLLDRGLAIDLLTLVLVLSMAALCVSVRSFARAGLLTRPDVTRLTVALQLAVLGGCFLWLHSLRVADDASDVGMGWGASVLVAGIVACLLAGGQRKRASVALALGLGVTLLLNTPGVTRSSPSSLRAQLADLELEPQDLARWEDAAAIHGALRAVGARIPDLADARERIARAMRSEQSLHPLVLTAAWRMGLVGDADWRAHAARRLEAYTLDELQRDGRLSPTPYYQYLIPMLLAARQLTPEERERVTHTVLACWPEEGAHGALERALACVRMLDALGRGDLVARQQGRTLALLRDCWISGEGARLFAKVGGFTSNPDKFVTSFDDQTLYGVELMARFGVPAGIDLWLLRSHLRRESHGQPLFLELSPELQAVPRASLLRLREEIGMPPRSWLAALLAERVLLATLLVVLLCLGAIRLAPPVVEAERRTRGAQP